jgi:hypothetical protein
MSPLAIRILLTLAIQMMKIARTYYGSMTPEQKAEWEKAIRECKDPMGGSGDGP